MRKSKLLCMLIQLLKTYGYGNTKHCMRGFFNYNFYIHITFSSWLILFEICKELQLHSHVIYQVDNARTRQISMSLCIYTCQTGGLHHWCSCIPVANNGLFGQVSFFQKINSSINEEKHRNLLTCIRKLMEKTYAVQQFIRYSLSSYKQIA